jgi:putative ABC transport system ATP-binding protein
MEMIKVLDIHKVYNVGKPNEFTAVRGATLDVDLQRMTVLKGPSGSGKTTLLGILGCMVRPTSGRIMLSGREITSLPERFLTKIRRQTFGFIFQQFNLIKGISTLENVMVPACTTGEKFSLRRQRAMGLLDTFNLTDKAGVKVEYLSGGEAQRVAIARALINNPAIIIADEPTAHLDPQLSREFMAIMGRLKNEGKTILMASHDPLVYDSNLVGEVIEMRYGAIIQTGDGT